MQNLALCTTGKPRLSQAVIYHSRCDSDFVQAHTFSVLCFLALVSGSQWDYSHFFLLFVQRDQNSDPRVAYAHLRTKLCSSSFRFQLRVSNATSAHHGHRNMSHYVRSFDTSLLFAPRILPSSDTRDSVLRRLSSARRPRLRTSFPADRLHGNFYVCVSAFVVFVESDL